MRLYHGTSYNAWRPIQSEGVDAPSYWGTEEQALAFADSFGAEGVVLAADIDEADLETSLLMAQALFESGDIDRLPGSRDIAFSMECLGGVTCTAVVRNAWRCAGIGPRRGHRP